MENIKNLASPASFVSPLMAAPHGSTSRILMDKATGDAPLLNIMRIYATGTENRLYKHGLRGTPLYCKWVNIKQRLFNRTNRAYSNYGGRGITMCMPWIYNGKLFCDYIQGLPHFGEKGLTLDRINNDGNYEPGNLRWANRHIQSANQNMRKANKTGFIGVTLSHRDKNPWAARIRINRKVVYIGNYKTPKEAAIARNNYIIANNLTEYKLNDIK